MAKGFSSVSLSNGTVALIRDEAEKRGVSLARVIEDAVGGIVADPPEVLSGETLTRLVEAVGKTPMSSSEALRLLDLPESVVNIAAVKTALESAGFVNERRRWPPGEGRSARRRWFRG